MTSRSRCTRTTRSMGFIKGWSHAVRGSARAKKVPSGRSSPISSWLAISVSSSATRTVFSSFAPPARRDSISARASSSLMPSSACLTLAFFRSYRMSSRLSTASRFSQAAVTAALMVSSRSGSEMTLMSCGKYALLAVRISRRFGSPHGSLVYGPSQGREPSQTPSGCFWRSVASDILRSACPQSHRIQISDRSPLVPRSSIHN